MNPNLFFYNKREIRRNTYYQKLKLKKSLPHYKGWEKINYTIYISYRNWDKKNLKKILFNVLLFLKKNGKTLNWIFFRNIVVMIRFFPILQRNENYMLKEESSFPWFRTDSGYKLSFFFFRQDWDFAQNWSQIFLDLLFFSAKIEILLRIGLKFFLIELWKLEWIWWSCYCWSRGGFINRRIYRVAHIDCIRRSRLALESQKS
jgi:hypothetical protein